MKPPLAGCRTYPTRIPQFACYELLGREKTTLAQPFYWSPVFFTLRKCRIHLYWGKYAEKEGGINWKTSICIAAIMTLAMVHGCLRFLRKHLHQLSKQLNFLSTPCLDFHQRFTTWLSTKALKEEAYFRIKDVATGGVATVSNPLNMPSLYFKFYLLCPNCNAVIIKTWLHSTFKLWGELAALR